MSDKNSKPEFEHFKLMYDNVYDELNRSRDWPIKIMAFASAAYFAMYSLIKFSNICSGAVFWVKIVLIIVILLLTIVTVCNIYNQHKKYIEYRDVQIQLQNNLKIHSWSANDKRVFPEKWQKLSIEKSEKQIFGLGWHFYAIYIIIVAIIAIVLVLLQ